MMMMRLSVLVTWLLLVWYQYCSCINAHQINSLNKLINSRRSQKPPNPQPWVGLDEKMKMIMHDHDHDHGVYTANQYGLKEADKIDALPGKSNDEVDFDQYSGYVTVDPKAGKALFYYFVESPQNSSAKPLVLWLNGGPGCSSLGYGAMQEVGPFRVSSDGKTLVPNKYAWNNVANVIFLESPAGVGFSYSNTTSDYTNAGDKSTAEDSYTFLVNWLERFPNYKTRDLFLAGESYAGHYIPQLAYTILSNNHYTSQTKVNLKGIAIGNAWVDENIGLLGIYDYLWAHALNSDETNAGIHKYCDSVSGNSSSSSKCDQYQSQGLDELGNIDLYNIYAPLCNDSAASIGSVKDFDPCSDIYVNEYLNLGEVQKALHVKATQWSACSNVGWMDSPITILPIIKQLVDRGISVWMYSGDTDGRVPVTSTRYAINTFKLPVETSWRSWYSSSEVGGYLVGYKGLTLITVREAGHMVPSYQPQRALTMISYFLQGKLPPSS